MNIVEYCRQEKSGLLKEWCFEENGTNRPEQYAYTSHKKVWWKCEKGHFYQSALKDRVLGKTGCPYCEGKKVLPGFNDLKSLNPAAASEWHPEKNAPLTPEDVTVGSEKKVWWKCELGHEWQATVENRALKGNRCPYCAGRKAWPGYNDLATLCPDLMKEWEYTLNEGKDPTKMRPGCRQKVWWKCQEGHVWQAYIFSRTSQKRPGCPVCAGNVRRGRIHN